MKKYSDVLLIFLLKGVRPQKFRDNYQRVGTGPPDGTPRLCGYKSLVERRLAAPASGRTMPSGVGVVAPARAVRRAGATLLG